MHDTLETFSGELVKIRSRMLPSLVGYLLSCCKKKSYINSRNSVELAEIVQFMLDVMVEPHVRSAKLKSVVINTFS